MNELTEQVWSKKSQGMKDMLKAIAPHDPTTGVCATCGNEIGNDEFRDDLSRKEYTISGMCQACQDSVFGA